MTMTETLVPDTAVLDRSHRCERCQAAAMVRITTADLGVWLLCGHCSDKHRDAIPGVLHVHDERNPLRGQR